jgi:hypothetical protein
MNTRSHIALILCPLLALLPGSALVAKAKEAGVEFPMKYEGGSLELSQHSALKTYVSRDSIVVVQGKERHVIPVSRVSEVNYGNDVHRRVGAAVGVGLVTLGVGALLLLVKTKKHYVGIIWEEPNAKAMVANVSTDGSKTDADRAGKGGIVFKVGKGDYRGFLTALEGMTGKKAVNADEVGSGGTSKQ